MTDSLHIYLTSSTIFVRKKTRIFLKSKLENVGEWSWKGHIPEALPWEMILPTAQSKKTPFVHIYLGGGMCKLMVFDLPENLNDFAETIAEAKTQMIQKLGINQTEWQFTIDTNHANQKVIICAAPTQLMEAIQKLAAIYPKKVISVSPYINGIWNLLTTRVPMNDKTALFICEEDAITVLVADKGAIQLITSILHKKDALMIEPEVERLYIALKSEAPIDLRFAFNDAMASALANDYSTMLLPSRHLPASATAPDFCDLAFVVAAQSESQSMLN
ncbi:hypothetical protein [Undibacterium sp. SXout20W]|uniref:hypothetical protein n=1 Tax=Undibacterium sp. SXout20W TaxID=3413051 RepID=UPI003BF1ADC0